MKKNWFESMDARVVKLRRREDLLGDWKVTAAYVEEVGGLLGERFGEVH